MATWSDKYWLAWLAVVFGMFLPAELWAVFSGHAEDTLSETMWTWVHEDLGHPWALAKWTMPHWLLFAFMTWLTLHLVWGYLR